MKHSEMLRLFAQADSRGRRQLTPAQQRAMIQAAGIEISSFYQEIEMEFPFVEIWRGSDPFCDMESLHSHSFYEIICCTEGGAQYLLGTSRSDITQGDLLVIPPGISHRRLSLLSQLPGATYGRYGMWLNAAHLKELGQSFPGLRLSLHEPLSLHARERETETLQEHLFRAWKEREKNGELSQAAIYGETILFLTGLCRAIQEGSQESSTKQAAEPDILDRILVCIDAGLSERITLAGLAERFFVSESYITHQFRHRIGMSFYQYVIQRRLIYAKTLIEEGMAMEEVALSAGFSSYSNFYRAFLKEYGIAPSGYRALQKESR